MDIVENRNVKPMQVSSQVAEKASSDGTTNKQCQAAHQQSTRTTVTEMHTNFADNPKPTLSQGSAVAAEEAGTDGKLTLSLRNRHSRECRRLWPRRPTPMVLELCSASRTIRML